MPNPSLNHKETAKTKDQGTKGTKNIYSSVSITFDIMKTIRKINGTHAIINDSPISFTVNPKPSGKKNVM